MLTYEKSLQSKIDYTAQVLISGTIRGQLWLAFSSFFAFVVYSNGGDIDGAIVTFLISALLSMGFFYAHWLKMIFELVLFDEFDTELAFIKRLMGFIYFLVFLSNQNNRFVRCFDIGQQWMTSSNKAIYDQAYEAYKQAIDDEIEKKRAKLAKISIWSAERRQRQYQRTLVKVAHAFGQTIHQLEGSFWVMDGAQLEQAIERHRYGLNSHQTLIESNYQEQMTPSLMTPKELPNIIPPKEGHASKLMYLAALIRAETDKYYDQLDFRRSDFNNHRYVYTSQRRGINLEYWQKNLPAINAYLGGEWMVEILDGTSLILSQLKELPLVLPFQEKYLKHGEIFYGFNVRTGEPYYNDLEKFPHHLIVGQSGSGKSVFLNQVMASVIHNINHFEKIYLVDLKGGVELSKYEGLHAKIQLVDDYDDLPRLLENIYKRMRDRLRIMRQKGHTIFDGPHMCVIVDEYAQIQQFEPITKEEKEAHKLLLSYLNRISMLGRAARVTIWAQLQKATVDNINASFRNNLQTKICFKVHSNSDAATVFGNAADLPGIASLGGFKNLPKGRFILSDDVSGEDVYMQAAMVDVELPLARLLQTADDVRVVSEDQDDERVSEAE